MAKRGVKPNPDRKLMAQHIAYSMSRAQAAFRKEPWEFVRQDWIDIWQPQWHLRGRGSDQLCMIRVNYDLAWAPDNIEIITNKVRLSEGQRKNHIGRTYNWKRREPK